MTDDLKTETEADDIGMRVYLDKNCFLTAYSHGYQLKWVRVNGKLEEVFQNAGYYVSIRQALDNYIIRRCRGVVPQNIAQLIDYMDKLDARIKDNADKIKTQMDEAMKKPKVDLTIGVEAPKKFKRKTKRAVTA